MGRERGHVIGGCPLVAAQADGAALRKEGSAVNASCFHDVANRRDRPVDSSLKRGQLSRGNTAGRLEGGKGFVEFDEKIVNSGQSEGDRVKVLMARGGGRHRLGLIV